jgi:DNA processing protein
VDQNYPNWLKDISCPPFIIFYKGNIELLNQNNVYIIGDFDDICTQLINYLNNFGIIVNKELSSLKEDENLINSLKNNRMCFFMNKGISEFKNNLNKNFLYYSYVYSFGKYVFVEKE